MNTGFNFLPEKLFNKTVKITNFPVNAPGLPRQRESFYSIKDGNWNDPTIWETVSGRIGKIPTASDDVYVRNTVSNSGVIAQCNNLFISSTGVLGTAGNRADIFGDMKCFGDFGSNTFVLYLYGYNNFIDKTKISTTPGTIGYVGTDSKRAQYILDFPNYAIINLTGGTSGISSGPKVLTADLTCSALNNTSGTASWLELESFNYTCTGITNSVAGAFIKRGAGSCLFIGNAILGGVYFNQAVDCEFQGGLQYLNLSAALQNAYGLNVLYTGQLGYTNTGTWNFTTNNQTLITQSTAQIHQWDCNAVVAAGITVTYNNGNTLQINGSLTGAGNFTNKGTLYWNNASAYQYTGGGTFDKDTFNTNIVGYIFNGSVTLPYTTYQGLYIAGTGTKTEAGATTIGTSLSVAAGATFTWAGNTTVGTTTTLNGTMNLLTYNATFTGAFSIVGATAVLSKTGAGSIIFGGSYLDGSGTTVQLTGNPTLEFRGGFSIYSGYGTNANYGSGAVSLTTNNQNIGANNQIFGSITVVGAITITNYGYNGSLAGIISTTSIDGTVAGSAFVNKASFYLTSNTTMMATAGSFDRASFANVIGYDFNGSITLPFTTYWSLFIGGTGIKTLAATLSLNDTLTVDVGSTLELSTFDLTVNGATTCTNGFLSKTGAGSLLFIGLANLGTVTFTGNPTVELRGGLMFFGGTPSDTGTGLWTFTTNNQNYDCASQSPVFAAPILISGAITLTLVTGGFRTFKFTNTINGNNAASTLDNRAANPVSYKSTTAPMLTGVLKCNGAANTWAYDNGGAQDVQGGNTHLSSHQYWHLTLGGSGAKTLQGDVSVTGTYTLSGTATKNNNGFTFGNP